MIAPSEFDYKTSKTYSSKVLVKDTPEYEIARRNNASAATPNRYPQEIHIVQDTSDISRALKRASDLGVTVGVRSGGHLYSCGALVHDGILIDTTHLNRTPQYDGSTQEVVFGPAIRVRELALFLDERKRFMPYGHSPTVAAGGYLLAGGQGWFHRGWGATCQSFVTKLEIVVPDGRTVIASRTENQDLFWAARGSGTGFFGVVSRFWCRTVPASRIWIRVLTFEIGELYTPILTWAVEASRKTPKMGTDLNVGLGWSLPDGRKPHEVPESEGIPKDAKLIATCLNTVYADTEEEAKVLLANYADDKVPEELRNALVFSQPAMPVTVNEMFGAPEGFAGTGDPGPGMRWQINSIVNDPSVPLPQLLAAIKPAITELPTLKSASVVTLASIVADEQDAAFSVAQDMYISSFTGWTDTSLEPAVNTHMKERYRALLPVSSGMYMADFNVVDDYANSNPLSDTALDKFLTIREKWDPKGLFPNYKRFIETHKRVTALRKFARL
ncbi:oxidoreductase, FAD-binding protein [Elsinoe ampelina]|uniref:Oxidoreductase, FAD-binding protein n=1 Tax=Elsinoe ampelina TaxID=302913 RepID=A0A6A6G5H6_9PEZI|nr:oxidoreductase, FAD-binding protein [Elsinoe ampelina]